MSNRQVQRDAQRERRRQERAKARRDVRQSRAPGSAQGTPEAEPAKRSLPWAWIIVGVIAAAILGGGLFVLIRLNYAPLPGKEFTSQGNAHINPGDPHPVYNSNPPTSGWHYPAPPQRGIYTALLPEELLIHFMEHAGVVVHYNPDKLPQDQLGKLRKIVNKELDKPTPQNLVVLSPDSAIPQPVAITSWQHLVEFEKVDGNESRIQDAIERLMCNYDPESVCGPQHGVSFQPTGTPVPGVATTIGAPIPSGVPQATPMPGQKTETPAARTPTP